MCSKPFRILCLDGGGSKGFYTIGVLKEMQDHVGKLHEFFDLIYGTSTGAIIATLIALGYCVNDIFEIYKEHVPFIMDNFFPGAKSSALEKVSTDIFKNRTFEDVRINLGVVASEWLPGRVFQPFIFESDIRHENSSIIPGFGCSLADAVQASCSAYPIFRKKRMTIDGENKILVDGGYTYNDPTMAALSNVKNHTDVKDIQVVSVGVGQYKKKNVLLPVQIIDAMLEMNALNIEILRRTLHGHIKYLRINDMIENHFVGLTEKDVEKLIQVWHNGRNSFNRDEFERAILS